MYICYNGKLTSEKNGDAAIAIMSPVYREEEVGERELSLTAGSDSSASFSDSSYSVTVSFEKKTENLFKVNMKWKNLTAQQRKSQFAFTVKALFDTERYLIPCVSMNGNTWGGGLEPKGLTRDGERWIFGYDREAIPSCTVLENSDVASVLFASDENRDSLLSSACVYKEGDSFYQQIWYPVREKPVTYSGRDEYGEGYESYRETAAGEEFSISLYLSVSRPRWKNFGIADTLDSALTLFSGEGAELPDDEKLWDDSIAFARSLITDYKGKKGFIIGFVYNPELGFIYRSDECFELAWCGQNVLFSRMLIEDYIKRGNRENLDDALEILDTRVALCTSRCGLLASQLSSFENLEGSYADTCNMGYGAYELLRVYQRLRDIGIEKPAYYDAAKGFSDFFTEHFSPEWGFGKTWKLSGECVDTGGTIGAFVILPLIEMYKLTGEEKYLEAAKRALHFYVERDLDNFACTAGALDTCCVDKETSAPIIMAGVNLYKLTGDSYALECAKKATYYFTSWMYHYQPDYPADSDFIRYGINAKGMTAVSAQHHHLDPYALIVVPYVRKLGKLTGDERFIKRAELMWRGGNQLVSDGNLVIHDVIRPRGSQNEAYFHCRWQFKGSRRSYLRGDANDWLVAWPCAFRMSALADPD